MNKYENKKNFLQEPAQKTAAVMLAVAAMGLGASEIGNKIIERNSTNIPALIERPPVQNEIRRIPEAKINSTIKTAEQRLYSTAQSLYPGQYPGIYKKGQWQTTPASYWTSGFFAGSLWEMYKLTGDQKWDSLASNYTQSLKVEENDTSLHDLGFIISPSFGQASEVYPFNKEYKEVILTSAKTLAKRYNKDVGAIQSWDDLENPNSFKVIIDSMMNIEMLFWASRNGGDKSLYKKAYSHAKKVQETLKRPDNSFVHVGIFDRASGEPTGTNNIQGYNGSSTWSRGQAWAIAGFAVAYRETGDPSFLETAENAADYFISNLPKDKVPYWDFDAPNIPNEPRDSSAAAIASAYLFELSGMVEGKKRKKYFRSAEKILSSLMSDKYIASSGQAILARGATAVPTRGYNTGLSYGDYYFLKAIRNYKDMTSG